MRFGRLGQRNGGVGQYRGERAVYPLVIPQVQGVRPMQANEILIIGATGKTGRRVAEKLEAKGHAVRRRSIGKPQIPGRPR